MQIPCPFLAKAAKPKKNAGTNVISEPGNSISRWDRKTDEK